MLHNFARRLWRLAINVKSCDFVH